MLLEIPFGCLIYNQIVVSGGHFGPGTQFGVCSHVDFVDGTKYNKSVALHVDTDSLNHFTVLFVICMLYCQTAKYWSFCYSSTAYTYYSIAFIKWEGWRGGCVSGWECYLNLLQREFKKLSLQIILLHLYFFSI